MIGVHSPKFLNEHDTYNHKIKRLDPGTASCVGVFGTGVPGGDDDDPRAASFSEPSGVGNVATLTLVGPAPPPRVD